ncbi:MAG TPA: HEAT repeat domain-containing protein [Patescibacteria group bacterium]|nr:HEAT repeat domain-containing protein [Patescibacteria group bacterium]
MDANERRGLANDWLKDFCLALKNVSLYSVDHPRGREYLDRAYESLRRLIGERRETTLTRADGRLYLDGTLLDRDRGLSQQFVDDLNARNVDSLVFHSTITPEEHQGLIRAMMAKPDAVSEKGGFDQILMDEGVSSVKTNSGRSMRQRESVDNGLLGEAGLSAFLMHQVRSTGVFHGTPAESATSRLDGTPMPTVTSVLQRDPVALTRAIEEMARSRENPPSTPEAMAELIADTLERLAERAIEEHQRDREEILADVGRAAVASDPEVHPPLFLEKAGPRSIRKNLASAVDGLPPDQIAELVAAHYPRAEGDFRRLTEILNRTLIWRDHRAAALVSLEAKMVAQGLSQEDYRELVDHLAWSEVNVNRRLELLYKGDYLWRVDFSRFKEVLVKLLATDQLKEATTLIQKYLSGLMGDDLEIRRRVADNARYILQLLEKTGKCLTMLTRISEMFFTRFQDEQDADVVARLSGVLAFLVDLRLRSGDLGAALDLMRKAEKIGNTTTPALKERGERLAESLSRAGNDKIFKTLTEMLLTGTDQSSMEAAEILKRGGGRSANYLIERLAEEENRSHRARLVMLLKETGKGSSLPFAARLEDSRWYLVRNVVGILGDIGDVSIMPQLRKVAAHSDPRVRREVVRTFVRFATPECEELIIAALRDEDRGVQITAVNALASLKGPRALGVMIDLARRSGSFENAPLELRQEAVAGLGRMGSKEALPVLSEILTRKGFLGYTEPTELRAAAARALGGLGSNEAVALLKELVQKDPRPQVREAAQESLQQGTPNTTAAVNQPRR